MNKCSDGANDFLVKHCSPYCLIGQQRLSQRKILVPLWEFVSAREGHNRKTEGELV